jgi:hypothetical protein
LNGISNSPGLWAEWRPFGCTLLPRARQGQESGRFLKKAAQKFLFYAGLWALSPVQPIAQHNKVFLLLFVHKK